MRFQQFREGTKIREIKYPCCFFMSVNIFLNWFLFISTSDPAELAAAGIEKFKEDKHDLIIVDTNGGHEHCSALFEEMHLLAQSMVCSCSSIFVVGS